MEIIYHLLLEDLLAEGGLHNMLGELDQLALQEASRKLSEMEGVYLLSDWRPVSSNVFILDVNLELLGSQVTNNIPVLSKWGIVVNFDGDKWGKVQVHPALSEKGIESTFAHQQFNGDKHPLWPVRNGNICTLTDTHGLALAKNGLMSEPATTLERVIWHVERALEWIKAAATIQLTRKGDFFEFPDFNIGASTQIRTIAYSENGESFETWENSEEGCGIAEYCFINKTVILKKFLNSKGRLVVYEPSWGKLIHQIKANYTGIWIKLKEVPTINIWQAPKNMSELVSALNAQGIDIKAVLSSTLKYCNFSGECLLFLGMPVPEKIGYHNSVYKWQALVLAPPASKQMKKLRTPTVLNHLSGVAPLKWFLKSENWHRSDFQKRSQVNGSLQHAKVLLIGCGALGSSLADQLCRMGVSDITLADPQILEAGNLVRHALDLTNINQFKAKALAERLNRLSPSANVKAITSTLPSNDKEFLDNISSFTLILDLTADDALLAELPFKGIHPDAIIISCSMGLHANKLFFYANTAAHFDHVDFNRWFCPFREEEHKQVEQIELPRGIGCWHPLTPAPINRVLGLAGVAVELIEKVYNGPSVLPSRVCHLWNVPTIS